MKKNIKSISVAIATYNGEKYLEEQLDSILNQTLQPTEIIIVDDASKDSTWDILQSYANQYPIIKIFKNHQNIGATKTFEKAVNLTSGEFIALSDQDDKWMPEKLAQLFDNIGNAKLIHSDAKLIDDEGKAVSGSLLALIEYYPINSFFVRLIREGVHGCCLMMRREVAKVASFIPEGFVYHDFFYNLTAASLGEVKTLSIPLMYYRLHANNACGLIQEKSYNMAMINYAKNLKNMELLVNLPQFGIHRAEIEFYINYYKKFVFNKRSSLSFILEVRNKLGLSKALGLIVNNVFEKFGVKVMYTILHRLKKYL